MKSITVTSEQYTKILNTTSLVDTLIILRLPYSMDSRKKLATQLGINWDYNEWVFEKIPYTGTADQNTILRNKILEILTIVSNER